MRDVDDEPPAPPAGVNAGVSSPVGNKPSGTFEPSLASAGLATLPLHPAMADAEGVTLPFSAPEDRGARIATGSVTNTPGANSFPLPRVADDQTGKLKEQLRIAHLSLVAVSATLLVSLLDFGTSKVLGDIQVVQNIDDHYVPDAERRRGGADGILEREVRTILFRGPAQAAELTSDLTIRDGSRGQTAPDHAKVTLFAPSAFVVHGIPPFSDEQQRQGAIAYSDFYPGGHPQYTLIEPPIPRHDPEFDPFVASGPWKEFSSIEPRIGAFQRLWSELSKMRHAYVFRSFGKLEAFRVSDEQPPRRDTGGKGTTGQLPIRSLESPLRTAPSFSGECRSLVPALVDFVPNSSPDVMTEFDARPLILTMDDTWAETGYDNFARKIVAAISSDHGRLRNREKLTQLRPGDILVTAPAIYQHVGLDLEGVLLSYAHSESRSRGDLKDTFPELTALWKDLDSDKNISPSLLRTIALRDQKGAEQKLEVAGLKIDQGILGFWGVVILLGLQIYLLVHLNELSRMIRAGSVELGTPWFALFPGKLPGVLAQLSLAALPLGAAGVVLQRSGGSHNLTRAVVAVCVASGLASLVIALHFNRLRALVVSAADGHNAVHGH